MPEILEGTLAVAYGRHVVVGHQAYRKTIGAGDSSVTTVVSLLGKGVWSGIHKAYYKGRLLIVDTDYRFHSGTLSESLDAATQRADNSWTQGIDSWLDGGQTYSGMAYVVTKISGLGIDDAVEDLKFICDTGMVNKWVGGVAVDPADGVTPIDQETELNNYEYLFYSTNPADCFADLIIKKRGAGVDSIEWSYWATFRTMCDAVVGWPGGTLAGIPTYASTGLATGENGQLSGSILNGWATTTSYFTMGTDGYYEFAPKTGPWNAGVTSHTTLTAATDIEFRLDINADGTVEFNGDAFATPLTWVEGDFFRIGFTGGAFFILKNGLPISLTGLTIPTRSTSLYGAAWGEVASFIIASAMRPYADPTRTRKRFECGLAFSQPTDIAEALLNLMYVTCSDMQYIDGKVCVIPPSFDPTGAENYIRNPIHDFTVSNIVEGTFEAHRLAKEQRPTNIKGSYRNIDDEYLTEDSVSVDRIELESSTERRVDGGKVWLGTMTRAQAECVMNSHMRVASDLDLLCKLKAGADAWRVMPGDVVTITHDVLEWDTKLFIVIEAVDDPPGENPDTKTLVLQQYMDNIYSDEDFSALDASITSFLVNQIKDADATPGDGSYALYVPDEAYDKDDWENSMGTPTKNAVRDKIESMFAGMDATYYIRFTTDGAGLTTVDGGTGKALKFASGLKLGFFGATPIVRPTSVVDLVDDTGGAGYDDGFVSNTGTGVIDENFSKVVDALNRVTTALRNLGLAAT